MITITLNELLDSVSVFRELSGKTLPIKAAYRIARLLRELDKESATFDESRRKIIDKYAQREENGEMKQNEEGNIIIQQDKIEECNNELVELLNTTIEINAEPLPIDDFGDIEITPAQLVNLNSFIVE